MYPKIVRVKANSEEYILEVTFDNDEIVYFDLKDKLLEPAYELLKDKAYFNTVKVDAGGYGLSWDDEIDISEFEIWTNGRKIKAL